MPAVPVAMQEWADHNGCTQDASDEVGNDVTLREWTQCQANADVEYYRVRGGGHTWPGASPFIADAIEPRLGKTTQTVDASRLMWEFFEGIRCRRPDRRGFTRPEGLRSAGSCGASFEFDEQGVGRGFADVLPACSGRRATARGPPRAAIPLPIALTAGRVKDPSVYMTLSGWEWDGFDHQAGPGTPVLGHGRSRRPPCRGSGL